MVYIPHNWITGETITEALMDHLETQYDEAMADATVLINARALCTSGTYTGNDVDNRAIPHGLGVVPKYVLIYNHTAATPLMFWTTYLQNEQIEDDGTGAKTKMDVTPSTTTNFYVDILANAAVDVYYWVAIG